MDSRKECAGYLADCYKEIFFGPVNKRYRSMTGAEMRKRLARLTEKGLAEVEKANELNDIHAMFAKVCACLMKREGHLKPGPQLGEWEENCRNMHRFCALLAKRIWNTCRSFLWRSWSVF